MDDEVRVGVLDGSKHLHEKIDPLANRKLPSIAITGQRHALNIFERHKWLAVRGDADIVQAGNVAMGQSSENVPLPREALGQVLVVEARMRQLLGHGSRDELIGAP